MRSLPGDAVSMLVLLRRAGEVGSAGLAGHGGGGARELVEQWLEGERDKGRRGKDCRSHSGSSGADGELGEVP